MEDLGKIDFHEGRRSGLSLYMVNVRIPIRYPSIDGEEAIGHTVWSFLKEIWTEGIILRVLRIHMASRALRLDEIF